MSGTTANGWPYVTPDDHPKEFPAASQALAQKLDTFYKSGRADWQGTGWQAVTFPAPFTAAPRVLVTLIAPNDSQKPTGTLLLQFITPSGFTFGIFDAAGAPLNRPAAIEWVALPA